MKNIFIPIIISIFIIEIISNFSNSNFNNIAIGRHTSTYVAKHPEDHIIHSTEDETILTNLGSRVSNIDDNHLDLSISLMHDDWVKEVKRYNFFNWEFPTPCN